MHDSIEAVMEAYKNELKEYTKWTNELRERTGVKTAEECMGLLGRADWGKITTWNETLKGMEKILGLSDEEIEAIKIECEANLLN